MRARFVVTWLCSLGCALSAAQVTAQSSAPGSAGAGGSLDPKLVGTRFAPLTWHQMSEAQKTMTRHVLDGPRTAMTGPFNVMLRSPVMGDLAQELGAQVRFNSTLAGPDEIDEILAGEEQEAFSIFAARVDLHGVDPNPVFEEGSDVSRTILRVAAEQQADLIVMGTRGRTRAASMLIGSETEHTLQSSDIAVLAVKHFGSRLRFLEALVDSRFRQKEEPRFS